MMIATCRGFPAAVGQPTQTSRISSSLPFISAVDLADGLVGELLQLALGAALVVLADLALLLQLAEVVHHVAADVADRDLALLGDAVDDLDHLPAALLVELGDLQADDVAVVVGRQPEVGLHDRLLDRADRALVVRRERQQPGVGRGDVGELLERRLGAVVVDDRCRSSRCGEARPVRTVASSWRLDLDGLRPSARARRRAARR